MLSPDQMNMAPMEVQAEEKKAVMQLANRLLTFCLSIGEFPAIRYQRGPTSASKVASQLDALIKPMEVRGTAPVPARLSCRQRAPDLLGRVLGCSLLTPRVPAAGAG